MTEKGPAVLVPTLEKASPFSDETLIDDDDDEAEKKSNEEVRSPIAQMLYSRWVYNLRESCKCRSLNLRSSTLNLSDFQWAFRSIKAP